uniref:Uncharacterized protein n=1 Tax=Anguilla anguilla TaxID=7936 RepID=A0A0E9TGI7_ANGAN
MLSLECRSTIYNQTPACLASAAISVLLRAKTYRSFHPVSFPANEPAPAAHAV